MKARRLSWHRGAAMVLAVGFAFALVGDRARAGLIPGIGIDPLEVLDLQVKPNVIIVLDSSGSMTETVLAAQTTTGDHPRSKMGQAKSVLQQVITNNDTKASFLFGQYTSNAVQQGVGRGGDRWYYGTDSNVSPSMLIQEVVLDYHAFQQMIAGSNTFVFGEEIGGVGSAESSCTFNVAPGFYRPGTGAGTLAAALQAGMNAPTSCSVARGTPNAYTVGWDAANRRFTFAENAGGNNHRWRVRWGHLAPAATIRRLITDNPTKATPGFTNGGNTCAQTACSGTVLRLTRRDTGMKFNDTVTLSPGPPPVTATYTFYTLRATRFWNGQTLHVLPPPSLTVCDVTTGAPGDGTPANPWYFNVAVRATCGAASGTPVKFTFIGSAFGGNNISCSGFQQNVALRPCDQTTPTQISQIGPFLEPQVAVNVGNAATTCATAGGCPIAGYEESTDGQFNQVTGGTPGGISAAGSTPVLQTILDIDGEAANIPPYPAGQLPQCPGAAPCPRPQRGFTELWFNGQAAAPGPPPVPAITPISTHADPKERTILLFITDGDPTCDDPNTAGGSATLTLALGSAWAAEQAFKRIDPAEPVSSLSTFFVAFGNGASVTRSNLIAWGGSGFTTQMVASLNGGVGQLSEPSNTAPNNLPGPNVGDAYVQWAIAPTATDKATLCPTCIDAFIAPDAATLVAQLEAILNQGASAGEFSAQQSVTSNVYEYTDLITGIDLLSEAPFDPANPSTRLVGFVPTRIVSTFSIPGFIGQLRAYTDVDGDGAVDGPGPTGERWSAGDKLVSLVATGRDGASGMNACISSGTAGECTFVELHDGAAHDTIATSAAAIKRRIYSTSRNDNFAVTAQDAVDLLNPGRIALWPPVPDNVTPTTDPPSGVVDGPLGLPATTTAADFANLQTVYHACKGIGAGGLPVDQAGSGHPCSASNPAATRAAKARRDAREMTVAFLAGAKFVPDSNGDPKRLTTGASEILYTARGWLLAEGTLSTPAVSAPPVADKAGEEPAPPSVHPVGYDDEYVVFRDGLREPGDISAGDAIPKGFGLRNPDRDSLAPVGPNPNPPPAAPTIPEPDTRENLKPVMTVVYAGTNLMLHAFRAGPCTASSTCTETGGEELWAFVPFDQLRKVTNRYLRDPQPRNPHEFMVAASLRFADVFVPGAVNTIVGGVNYNSACNGNCNGVWRRILYVGRGIGGKYFTALDVTGPGRYTLDSLSTSPPLVYWNRGNPDTTDGAPGGPQVNGGADFPEYATMGQTWSLPAVNFVDATLANGGGVDFVLNMGSGYSDHPLCLPGLPPAGCPEGHNFYTVDALTGNMIASVDVDAAGSAVGGAFARATPPFPTAIVANVAGYARARFNPGLAVHPARDFTTRNYVGDIQGRLWKFVTANPSIAVPVADIGVDQPLGAPLALFGLLGTPGNLTASQAISDPNLKPTIFGSSGFDNRIPLDPDDPVPQFKNFALLDNASDIDTSVGAAAPGGIGIDVFSPNIQFLFGTPFDPGSNFRGTLQPTTAALDRVPPGAPDGAPDGVVVFFGGTRFNPIGSPFVTDPCRSSFDSIVFALDINTGGAAFPAATGADGYTIFQDSRLVGLFTTYSPDTGSGGKLVLDEGLVQGTVAPPPPAGQPAGTFNSNYSVTQTIRPLSPAPGVRFGSTVCQ